MRPSDREATLAAWCAAWDRHELFQSFFQGLGCGTAGFCRLTGGPTSGVEAVLLVILATLAAFLVALQIICGCRLRRVILPGYALLVLTGLTLQRQRHPTLLRLPQPLSQHGHERGHYVPGAIEREWIQPAASVAGRICALANSSAQLSGGREWLEYARVLREATAAHAEPRRSIAAVRGRQHPMYTPLRPIRPSAAQHRVLSRFMPVRRATSTSTRDSSPASYEAEYIEPLTGIARHPLTALCVHGGPGDADLFDINYLVLSNACDKDGRPPPPSPTRNFLFDLGCSVYDDGVRLDIGSGSGGGPSLPLLFQLFERRCRPFDVIHGWEAKPTDAAKWWKNVPPAMRARLHFHNVPIQEGSMTDVLVARKWKADDAHARAHAASNSSFLRMLRATAKPEDFVVVKVDVDGGPELQVVHAIALLPELAALVDELFFEAHFHEDADVRDFGWGFVDRTRTIDNTLQLMQRLRVAGVRSHFWI